MAAITKGSLVTMHYKGSFADGEVFESSYGSDPLVFRVGNGEIIPGLDLAVIGMEIGETKDVAVPPELGYGDYRDELVVEVVRVCCRFADGVDAGVHGEPVSDGVV